MLITKTDFIKYYLDCPSSFWYKKKRPEVLKKKEIDEFGKSHIDQGYEFERLVEEAGKDAVKVEQGLRKEESVSKTKELLDSGVEVMLQAAFMVAGLYARVDLLEYLPEVDAYDIYEIKATTSQLTNTSEKALRKKHIKDATFQKIVLEKAGLRISSVYLILTNVTQLIDYQIPFFHMRGDNVILRRFLNHLGLYRIY